jgi:hypothetical protein
VDRLRGDAFVVAVVDLAQEWGQLCIWEAGDLGGAPGALKWTRVNGIEMKLGQPGPECRRLLFAVTSERQIGSAGVTAVQGPLGLAVPGEIDLEGQAGLPIISGLPERSERLALSMTAPALTRCPGRMQTSPTNP